MRDFVPVRTFFGVFLERSEATKQVFLTSPYKQLATGSPVTGKISQLVLTGTKSRIFLNSKVQGLTLPREV